MWIQSTREAHAGNQFKDPRVGELNAGEAVSFSKSGTAQVSAAVGEYLIDEYDAFEATDEDGDADAETEDTVEDDDLPDFEEALDDEDTDEETE